MIYIYTISSDQSCNYIIDWLIKLKVHYKRVNSDFCRAGFVLPHFTTIRIFNPQVFLLKLSR